MMEYQVRVLDNIVALRIPYYVVWDMQSFKSVNVRFVRASFLKAPLVWN